MDTVAVSIVAACCSIVLGGRLGTTRSGKGVDGAFPYWNAASFVSSPLSQLPVDPTKVTALKFDGDVGALGIKVSTLPDVETDGLDGTPK